MIAEFESVLKDESAHIAKYKRTSRLIKALGIGSLLVAWWIAGTPWNWTIAARDAADKARPVSPLRQAEDAALLDTSDLDIDAAFAAALALVSQKVESALQDRHRG